MVYSIPSHEKWVSQPNSVFLSIRSERCMRDSGGLIEDVPNNKLDQAISDEISRG